MSTILQIKAGLESIDSLFVPQFQIVKTGWDDFTTMTFRAEWFSEGGVLLFDLALTADDANTVTLSPTTDPIDSETPHLSEEAKYFTWGELPNTPESYKMKFRLRVTEPSQTGSTFEMNALWIHHPRNFVGTGIAGQTEPLTVNLGGVTVNLAVSVGGVASAQTGAEIKIAYEAEPDTNAFDDAAVLKLAGIDPSVASSQFVVKMVFQTDTTTADPGAAGVRLNNALHTSATELYLSSITDNGVDLSPRLPLIREKDFVSIVQTQGGGGEVIGFILTGPVVSNDGGAWFTFPVLLVGSGIGGFGDNKDIDLEMLASLDRSLPIGGDVGQVVVKTGPGIYEVGWGDIGAA